MALDGQRVFVVEDDIFIALDIEHMICTAQGEVAGRTTTLDEALKLAETPRLSLAILDFSLGADNSLPVAAKLDSYGVPFLFYTAYEAAEISEAWPSAPVVRKPARPDRLVRALESLVSPKG